MSQDLPTLYAVEISIPPEGESPKVWHRTATFPSFVEAAREMTKNQIWERYVRIVRISQEVMA